MIFIVEQYFPFSVAKDSNNPSMLKLVLQALCSDWDMNYELLTQDTTSKCTVHSSHLQSNGSEKTIGDHQMAMGTDGAQCAQGESEATRRQRHHSDGKYCSITSVCQLDQQGS